MKGWSSNVATPLHPTKVIDAMSERQHTLLWMQDLLDHLGRCQEQLAESEDEAHMTDFLTDAILLDLQEYRQLCERFRRRKLQRDPESWVGVAS